MGIFDNLIRWAIAILYVFICFSDTPLIVAAQCGFNDFTALLIDNKADVNAVNNESRSAMDFVSERGYTEILEQLLMAGADGK